MKNAIVYLIGFPGVGKFSVAKELCRLNPDFKLIDNHIPANMVFSFSTDTKNPKHLEYRIKARNLLLEAIGELARSDDSFIFTNVLYKGENDWYEPIEKLAQKRNALFVPVVLTCSLDEHKRRIVSPERKEKLKAIRPVIAEAAQLSGMIEFEHPNKTEIDTTNLSAEETAALIMEFIGEKL